MNISRIINSIETQTHSLKSAKKKPIDTNQAKAISEILEQSLSELESSLAAQPEFDKKIVVRVLTDLDRQLKGHEILSVEKVSSLRKEIAEIKKSLHQDFKPAEVRFVITLDIDHEDHNGAIARGIQNCIETETAFITTSTLLSCSMITNSQDREKYVREIQESLSKRKESWDILQQEEIGTGKQFLVLIPKKMRPELTLAEKIELMDLNPKVLRSISLDQALAGPHDIMKFKSLQTLFAAHPRHTKLIYLNGHGKPQAAGGLNTSHFNKFIQLMEAQNCRGLTILSCYAGGESTLNFLPEKEEKNRIGSGYDHKISFLVLIRSAGDYVTWAGSEAEMDLNAHFDVMETALVEAGGATEKKFTEAMIRAEKGFKKHAQNLVQIYFPQSPESPGGFMPLNEVEGSLSLTYTKLRTLEQESRNTEEGIVIKKATTLRLYPQIFDVSMTIEGAAPPILSATPGTSHHYIRKLRLSQSTFSEFLDAQRSFYKETELKFSKAFFIDQLDCVDGSYQGVVILCKPPGVVECLYTKEKTFERIVKDKTQSISDTAYSMLAINTLFDTTPSPEAVRFTSGGQENESVVDNFVLRGEFIRSASPFNPKEIPQKSDDELLKLYRSLVPDEKSILIFDLMKYKRSDLVEKLLLNGELDPNMMYLGGKPLLHTAMQDQNESLFMNLLKAGADPNCQDSQNLNNSALHIALRSQNKVFLETLLADKRINPNVVNDEGVSLLCMFAFIPGALHLLLNAGANLYQLCGKDQKSTILSMVCRYPLPNEFRKQLLDTGIDPNMGIPPPIESAALHGDEELLDMLIAAGANPFFPQRDGPVAIHEIVLRATKKIIDKLLNIQGAYFAATDAVGKSLLDTAIQRHDFELSEELLKRGVRLGKWGDNFHSDTLKRIEALDNFAFIKLLVDYHQDTSPNLGAALINSALYNNPLRIIQYFQENVITDPNIEFEGEPFFGTLASQATWSWVRFKPLVEFFLSLKVNVNIDIRFYMERQPLIEQVLDGKNKELAELLIKNGLDREIYKKTLEKLNQKPPMALWLSENGFIL